MGVPIPKDFANLDSKDDEGAWMQAKQKTRSMDAASLQNSIEQVTH